MTRGGGHRGCGGLGATRRRRHDLVDPRPRWNRWKRSCRAKAVAEDAIYSVGRRASPSSARQAWPASPGASQGPSQGTRQGGPASAPIWSADIGPREAGRCASSYGTREEPLLAGTTSSCQETLRSGLASATGSTESSQASVAGATAASDSPSTIWRPGAGLGLFRGGGRGRKERVGGKHKDRFGQEYARRRDD